jgi:hypothetical protein
MLHTYKGEGPLPDLKHLKGGGSGTGRVAPPYLLAIRVRRCVNSQEAAIRGPEQALWKFWSGVREKRFATLRIPELERCRIRGKGTYGILVSLRCNKIPAIWRPENIAWLFLNALASKEVLARLCIPDLNDQALVFSHEQSKTGTIGGPHKNLIRLWLYQGRRSQRCLEMDGAGLRVQDREPGRRGSEARRIGIRKGGTIGRPLDASRTIALIIPRIGNVRCPEEVPI